MRRIFTLSLIVLLTALFSAGAMAKKPGSTSGDPVYNGNGSPSGKHFNLNILGKDWDTADASGAEDTKGNGHRIFVRLGSSGNPQKTKIMLGNSEIGNPCNGKDFCVTDYDGTDGYAEFYLPNPDENCDGVTEWSVYARALGPDGKATMYTCLNDGSDNWCSTAADAIKVFDRTGGGGAGTFTNVSRELFYVTANIDGTIVKRYPLFSYSGYTYWWEYDNEGLRLVQFRFYELPTDIGDAYPIDEVGDNCA